MDDIKFPKNFVLSRDNMHAIFDAFGDGRSVTEIAAEMVQSASSKKVSRPPAKASSRALKPSSRSAKPSSRGGSSSTLRPAGGSRSAPASSEGVGGTFLPIVEQTPTVEQVEQGIAHSPGGVSGEKSEFPVTKDKEASGTGMEIILLDDQVSEVSAQNAPASVRIGSEGALPKTGDKRPALSETSAPSPAWKKSKAATGPSPALPPLGKKKGVPAVPSLSPSGNVLNRRIEEARLEENLSATSDARGNLVAAREQIQSLQGELRSALEALKKADEKAAETAGYTKSLEAELSQTREVLRVSDERAAALEVRCEGVLKQLSSVTEALSERDEAVRQKAEVQQQYGVLKADFEELQAQLEEAKAQKEATLARVECIAKYQESDELKRKIEQACEAHLQDYKDSSELKEFVAEACEAHLNEYKASGEMGAAVLKKAFRI
ncbi:uncharacterized abhydrolase domain-containing protein DDB_G0269086-like [Manihot esculenta]|uniref:uncharacterized abhydrolase domain-containing protein DDB_G0269086-like n=1 Tax=Manihot esculenta TaxID=3983 RepID=UPI001CC7C81C|nr:uncharacterized abhydrolase domain-containing protein DDB_G0269086-like [Manihot esculenta]